MSPMAPMVVILVMGFVATFLLTWRIRGRGFSELLELFGQRADRPTNERRGEGDDQS